MSDARSDAPLIAVCTPVYNGAQFLAETMASVQAQTYPNLVHVVLDNASTDATPEIIAGFSGGRVPLIVARNPATIPALLNFNRALAAMPGEAAYFCLLCADDLLLPEALARMAAILQADPDVRLVAAAQPDRKWNVWPAGAVFSGREIAAAYLRGDLPASFAHSLYRRDAFAARAHGFYDAELYSADVDAALATMLDAKIGYVHEPSVVTREHPNSISARVMSEDRIHYAEWLVLLGRYGAEALGPAEARRVARQLKRHYFRRMLRWGLVERKVERVRKHTQRLGLANCAPSFLDYLDALIDWPLRKLGLRPRWTNFRY